MSVVSAAEELQFQEVQEQLAHNAAAAKQSTGPANIDDVVVQMAGNMGPQQEEIGAALKEEGDFLAECVKAVYQVQQEDSEEGGDSDDSSEQEHLHRQAGVKRQRHEASMQFTGGQGDGPYNYRGGRGRGRRTR